MLFLGVGVPELLVTYVTTVWKFASVDALMHFKRIFNFERLRALSAPERFCNLLCGRHVSSLDSGYLVPG